MMMMMTVMLTRPRSRPQCANQELSAHIHGQVKAKARELQGKGQHHTWPNWNEEIARLCDYDRTINVI